MSGAPRNTAREDGQDPVGIPATILPPTEASKSVIPAGGEAQKAGPASAPGGGAEAPVAGSTDSESAADTSASPSYASHWGASRPAAYAAAYAPAPPQAPPAAPRPDPGGGVAPAAGAAPIHASACPEFLPKARTPRWEDHLGRPVRVRSSNREFCHRPLLAVVENVSGKLLTLTWVEQDRTIHCLTTDYEIVEK